MTADESSLPKKPIKRKSAPRDPQDLALRQVQAVHRHHAWPTFAQWRHVSRVLTRVERHLLQAATAVGVLSLMTMGGWFVATHRVEVPAIGGSYTEALAGTSTTHQSTLCAGF